MEDHPFAPRTQISPRQYFRLELDRESAVTQINPEAIRASLVDAIKELFGSANSESIDLRVEKYGDDYIASVPKEFANQFHTSVLIAESDKFNSISVVGISPFLQPLLFNSRTFYPPI